MKLSAIAAAATLSLTALTGAQAATVVITPVDVGNAPVINQWYRANYRDVSTGFTSNTVAAITTAAPRSGNGSIEMSSTDGTGKADYAYTWGYVAGNTLGNLTSLGFDWYRSGTSTNSPQQAPAMRLLVDADGSSSTTNDRAYLVWEQTYQVDPTVAVDSWVSRNIIGGDFWQRRLTPGTTIEQYDTDLGEWMDGANYAGALVLGRTSAVLGIEVGIGSGWSGNFRGFIDNVSYGFGGDSTTFNFEADGTAVPEPWSLALVGVGLLGVAVVRRRR